MKAKRSFCDSHLLKTATMHPKSEVPTWVAPATAKPSDRRLPGQGCEHWSASLSTISRFPLTTNWGWKYFQNMTDDATDEPEQPASVKPLLWNMHPPALPPIIMPPTSLPKQNPLRTCSLRPLSQPLPRLPSFDRCHLFPLHYPNLPCFISLFLTRLRPHLAEQLPPPPLFGSQNCSVIVRVEYVSCGIWRRLPGPHWLFAQVTLSQYVRLGRHEYTDVIPVVNSQAASSSHDLSTVPQRRLKTVLWSAALRPEGNKVRGRSRGRRRGMMGKSQRWQRMEKGCSQEPGREEGSPHRPEEGPLWV